MSGSPLSGDLRSFELTVYCANRYRTGSNGFKTFAGFKDDGTHGAVFDFHSCEKRYYYV